MASMIRLRWLRKKSRRCMLTTLCVAIGVVCLLFRENVSVAKDDGASTKKIGNAWSQITISASTPTSMHKFNADITTVSKRVQAGSFPMLRYLSITHNKEDVWDNLHKYKFSMKANNCKGGSTVVMIVHTAMYNAQKRQNVRKDMHDSKLEPFFSVVFLVGETTNMSLQAAVERESEKYQDIVQGNFIDSYRNLTHKHIMGYHWVITHCKNVHYVIKIDDDVVVHLYNVLRYLLLNPVPEEHILCHVEKFSKKKTAGKWLISEQEYPFIRFPPYCAGFAYITTLPTIKKLHAASTYIRSIWIDDVYATGMLALASNTTLKGLPKGQYYNRQRKPPARFKTEGLFVLYHN